MATTTKSIDELDIQEVWKIFKEDTTNKALRKVAAAEVQAVDGKHMQEGHVVAEQGGHRVQHLEQHEHQSHSPMRRRRTEIGGPMQGRGLQRPKQGQQQEQGPCLAWHA